MVLAGLIWGGAAGGVTLAALSLLGRVVPLAGDAWTFVVIGLGAIGLVSSVFDHGYTIGLRRQVPLRFLSSMTPTAVAVVWGWWTGVGLLSFATPAFSAYFVAVVLSAMRHPALALPAVAFGAARGTALAVDTLRASQGLPPPRYISKNRRVWTSVTVHAWMLAVAVLFAVG